MSKVRATRQRCMRLTIVHQSDKLNLVFRNFLAEDRHSDTTKPGKFQFEFNFVIFYP